MSRDSGSDARDPLALQQLVTVTDPQGPAAEAYRTLRTNLRFAAVGARTQVILVTGPGPGEGKSTTAANLAVTAAQGGARVALLDCDLRQPRQHAIFGVPNTTGLAGLFLEPATAMPELQSTAVPGLCLLTSGPRPPNPADLLASDRFDHVVEQLRAGFDLVLLDCAPVVVAADASILAPRADGVLLVVEAGRTRRELARRAQAQLERVQARMLGVVLNNAPVKVERYG